MHGHAAHSRSGQPCRAVIEALSARLQPRPSSATRGGRMSAWAPSSRPRRSGMCWRRPTLIAARMRSGPRRSGKRSSPLGADAERGAFVPPMLFLCPNPDRAQRVHDTEAFGPVSTVMGYRDLGHAIELANKGQGSLVASVITHDPNVARDVVLGAGAYHGRLYINNRDSMAESTGHGAPLPHMIHGGPGRAGGGEEMGGIRGVLHYMQRTAVQGSPDILISHRWYLGARCARRSTGPAHPFTRRYHDLSIGETLHTDSRTISMDDIEHFRPFHRRHVLCPHGRGGGQAEPVLPGPGRARVSTAFLRRRPFRRAERRPGAGQYRAGRAALHEASLCR